MSLLGSIGSVLGSVLGPAGGIIGSIIQDRRAKANNAAQIEAAKSGVQWRAEDARRAGISPLVALGANIYQPNFERGGDWETSLSNLGQSMGQDISRAVNATRGARARQEVLDNLTLEHASLQNDMLRSQIMRMNQQVGPALPSSSDMPLLTGQGDTRSATAGLPYVEEHPLQRIHSMPGRPEQEVGAIPDFSYVRTKHGYGIVPSGDVKQRIEDQFLPELLWSIRNIHLPGSAGPRPPNPKYFPLPKGFKSWKWNPWIQEFRPSNKEEWKYFKMGK